MRNRGVNTYIREGGGGAAGARASASHGVPMERTRVEQVTTLQPIEDPLPEHVYVSWRICSL